MRRLIFAAAITAAFLTGCGGKKQPQPTRYTLEPTKSAQKGTYTHELSIKLSAMRSPSAINSTKMFYKEQNGALYQYANALYAEFPVVTAEQRLRQHIMQSAIVRSVLPSFSTANGDLLLESSLNEFTQSVLDGNITAEIKMDLFLVDAQSQKPLSQTTIRKSSKARTFDAAGATAALSRALDEACIDAVQWLNVALKADR